MELHLEVVECRLCWYRVWVRMLAAIRLFCRVVLCRVVLCRGNTYFSTSLSVLNYIVCGLE
jgi:hypothetical protein